MNNVQFDTANYWQKRLTHRFDLTGVGFRRKSVSFNKWVYKVRKELLEKIISDNDWLITGKTVLDVGSGTGYFIDYWIKRTVASVTGIDIAEISVNKLKEAFPQAKFLLADLSDPALELDETFDYVSIFDVLFHIVDDRRFANVAANLSRFCRPGCKIFITDLFGKTTFAGVKHCRNRSLAIYEKEFSARGFRLFDMKPLFFTLLPPSGLRNPILRWTGILLWEAVTFLTRWSAFGNIIGAILYHIDSALRKIFQKGPGGYIAVFEYLG